MLLLLRIRGKERGERGPYYYYYYYYNYEQIRGELRRANSFVPLSLFRPFKKAAVSARQFESLTLSVCLLAVAATFDHPTTRLLRTYEYNVLLPISIKNSAVRT